VSFDEKKINEKNDEIEDIKDFYIAQLEQEIELLKNSLANLRRELNKLQELPLIVCEVKAVYDDRAVIKLYNGNVFYVSIKPKLKGQIKEGDLVLVNDKYLSIIDKLPEKFDSEHNIKAFFVEERPKVGFKDVIGLDEQIEELKEVIEYPLKYPELFKKLNIEPPKGVLLYGPPGTGKTLLAKAVANESNAKFIYVSASELVQKYIGEGAKLVREIFELARKNAPSIIFIDEIDAIAHQRDEGLTGGEREVARTLNQLLTELDGFRPLDNVKVIAATNRIEILDPALLRPGRFDKLIKVDLPDKKAREEMFKYYLKKSNYKNVNFKLLAEKTEGFSGADIKAVVTEAGLLAIKNKRSYITQEDLEKAIKKMKKRKEELTKRGINDNIKTPIHAYT
jgi:proteasome regulatory subunit